MFLENKIGPGFRQCVNQIASHQPAKDGQFPLPSLFYAENICSISLIDRHNGFFALVGTVFVAIFTGTLWRTTDRLVQITNQQRADLERSIKAAERAALAAELNAKAILGVEGPILAIEDVIVPNFFDINGEIEYFPVVVITNYGRTPAFVDDVILNISMENVLPIDPSYQHLNAFPDGFVIMPGASYRYVEYNIGNTPGLDHSQMRIHIERNTVFFYGMIYYRNFLNERYERGFIRGVTGQNSGADYGFLYKNYEFQRPRQTEFLPIDLELMLNRRRRMGAGGE